MRMLEKISRLLAERGMTQGELEKLAGLSANRISKWNGGVGEPTARQAVRIAGLLRVPVGWLADDDQDGEPVEVRALTDDQRAILEVVEVMGLQRREALRRLTLGGQEGAGDADFAVPDRPAAAPRRRAKGS